MRQKSLLTNVGDALDFTANKGGYMKYVFTDFDNRSYERKTKGPVSVSANKLADDKIEFAMAEDSHNFISLSLSMKEAHAIVSALSCSINGCKSIITT